jgi:glutathione S-transferase
MTVAADALILHQYEISPFSEKVRVVLGIKGLSWRACNQPPIMPKPEMVALTGGYRRIPVLQVGADLYFDSLYIIEELERRFPQAPSAFSGSGVGLARAFSQWTDGALFMGLVGLLFGGEWKVDQAFLDDRSALMGQPFDPDQFAAAGPALTLQLRQHLDVLDEQLADGRRFLTGDRPDAIDAAVYCQAIFARWGAGAAAQLIDGFPRVCAWEGRVKALGHGQRATDVDREAANAVAMASTPAPIARNGGDGTLSPGDRVSVKFHDANTPLLEGELLRIDLNSLSLKPERSAFGDIHIHMPRSVGALQKR